MAQETQENAAVSLQGSIIRSRVPSNILVGAEDGGRIFCEVRNGKIVGTPMSAADYASLMNGAAPKASPRAAAKSPAKASKATLSAFSDTAPARATKKATPPAAKAIPANRAVARATPPARAAAPAAKKATPAAAAKPFKGPLLKPGEAKKAGGRKGSVAYEVPDEDDF